MLVQPSVSQKAAKLLNSPVSRPLVGYYIHKYHIDMTGCEKTQFDSFNDFFTRKKRIRICNDKQKLGSPCDGFLSAYRITDDLRMQIKHSTYSVASLLQSRELAEQFRGGLCCVFRLEPWHYHRYLYAVSGSVLKQKRIPGILHCVRPIACAAYPVYVQNSREYTVIRHPALGNVIQMEVGALLVGKIHNHRVPSAVAYGMEKGYFEYGGSTIILLFRKDAMQLLPQYSSLPFSGNELPVRIGQPYGSIL
ncbi:MAG: phosphatidylserine decarboxylase [Oscillospiraceae bacterium]|nr:phosphatidylserine decarboxylase [Oscillospiraceae bacterium]